MKLALIRLALLFGLSILIVACGGGGGGGDTTATGFTATGTATATATATGTATSTATGELSAVKFTVDWPERTRALSAPGSALSARFTVIGGAANGQDKEITANRQGLAATRKTYTTGRLIRQGTLPFEATFYAQADAKGDVVAFGQGQVTVNGDAEVPTITLTGTVSTVTVAGGDINLGDSEVLTAEARTQQGNLLALTPGSFNWHVLSGSQRIDFNNGQTKGKVAGPFSVVCNVDGVNSNVLNANVVDPDADVAPIEVGDMIVETSSVFLGPSDLYITGPNLTNPRLLAHSFAPISDAVVTTNRKWVYFLAKMTPGEEFTGEIWGIRVDGTKLTKFPFSGTFSRISVQPGTDHFAAIQATEGGLSHMYVGDFSAGTIARLPSIDFINYSVCSWNPVEDRILFQENDFVLSTLTPQGTGRKNTTTSQKVFTDAVYDATGDRVLSQVIQGGFYCLRIDDLLTHTSQVIQATSNVEFPIASPDTDWIYYTTRTGLQPRRIERILPETGFVDDLGSLNNKDTYLRAIAGMTN